VTNSFGSPTLWSKIAEHCQANQIALPSLRRVLCAGAPVPLSLWKQSAALLPNGKMISPYGATESLPVASVSAEEIRARSGDGACIGKPVTGMDVRIIALTDLPVASLDEATVLPPGKTGEIIVRGPVVTRMYDALPEATRAAKIRNNANDDGEVWHRMGDCGLLDDHGYLWFYGRKAERVQTAAGPLFTEPCEKNFREHPSVRRCALVGIGRPGAQRPALVVEVDKQMTTAGKAALAHELRAIGRDHPATKEISLFFFRSDFPVDVRHNAKIHRLRLGRWASHRRGIEVP
jgi:acyl-CoA synthetase (AMP-forming)/AMP-acid ligase II